MDGRSSRRREAARRRRVTCLRRASEVGRRKEEMRSFPSANRVATIFMHEVCQFITYFSMLRVATIFMHEVCQSITYFFMLRGYIRTEWKKRVHGSIPRSLGIKDSACCSIGFAPIKHYFQRFTGKGQPFWRLWNAAGSDGQGVIGVLEANFVEPAHDKQGFERTTVLSRLEARLQQMQKTYWTSNCHKIGYAPRRNKKFINGSEDKASSPEHPQSALHGSGKGPQKSASPPDYSKNGKTHDLPGLQNSGKSALHSSRRMAESLKESCTFEEVASCEGAEVEGLGAKFMVKVSLAKGACTLALNKLKSWMKPEKGWPFH